MMLVINLLLSDEEFKRVISIPINLASLNLFISRILGKEYPLFEK